MFDYDQDLDMTFGLKNLFYMLSSYINEIQGYKLLLESVENFYPEDNIEAYKSDLNKLIKFKTNTLVSTLDELNTHYNNIKEDTNNGL